MSKNDKTIQEQINELSVLVSWFDSKDFELEKALEKFEEAKKLAASIEARLETLQNDITIVKKD
ncbi:MAG TPA: exodeoxyribonuclease VII small subunit, partial [Candidatus Saccharibacteria bacterium]|nr:exodeoxyribonuclease VII small subunit [Candidatus Saccharibacteria bacterium]